MMRRKVSQRNSTKTGVIPWKDKITKSTDRQQNGAIDESGNVDRIRNILFGSQMRDYDGRFQKMEERLTREAGELRSDLQRQLQALEAS